ncbi:MAG: GGDEF domain-containing protein [Rhodanobacteraceae bacterium]|nr:GGDEF domain-containing protein [Rhodanobacteraceae bacterium]
MMTWSGQGDITGMLWRLLILLLVGVVRVANAQAILVLDSHTPGHIELRDYLGVLRDPSGALDERAIRLRTQEFHALSQGSGLNLSYTRDVIWLRLMVRSALDVPSEWRLELDYASLDHADLYDPAAAGPQLAGDRVAFGARPLPHRNPLFALTLAPGESRELLLSIRSEGSLTLNPTLWRAAAFYSHSENTYALHALYFGMLLALAGYNLLLYLALRDRLFLYYVLFVISVGLGIASIYGLAGQYLWPDAVDWSNRSLVVSFAISGIVGPLFTQMFLGTARYVPGWDRWLVVGIWSSVGMLAIGLWASMRLGMRLMSLSTLLNCALMLGCGILCIWRRVPGARLYVVAWAVLLLGGALMALRNFGLLPTHFVTLHGMQIGSVLEMLLLSFALANRFNQIKQEKAAAQAQALVAQQALVASLQKQERELERRVAERTDALEAANRRLHELALRDPLTGLANRAALYAQLGEALQTAHLRAEPVCLLMVDLDGFKAVNDQHGHGIGDRVLVQVADRLRASARPTDLVARLGGDEFVVMAQGLDLPAGAQDLAQRMLSAIAEPLNFDRSTCVGASIGIAISSFVAEDPDELLRRADAAMYSAKASGRGAIRWAGEDTTRAGFANV